MAVPTGRYNSPYDPGDPYGDMRAQQMAYMQEMMRQQRLSGLSQSAGSSLQNPLLAANPVPQPEPRMNPVLLLLE